MKIVKYNQKIRAVKWGNFREVGMTGQIVGNF